MMGKIASVEFARAQPAEFLRQGRRADSRDLQNRLTQRQRYGGTAGRDRCAAAFGVEARVDDAIALDDKRDPHEVATRGPAGTGAGRVRRCSAAADRVVQMFFKALVWHDPTKGTGADRGCRQQQATAGSSRRRPEPRYFVFEATRRCFLAAALCAARRRAWCLTPPICSPPSSRIAASLISPIVVNPTIVRARLFGAMISVVGA